MTDPGETRPRLRVVRREPYADELGERDDLGPALQEAVDRASDPHRPTSGRRQPPPESSAPEQGPRAPKRGSSSHARHGGAAYRRIPSFPTTRTCVYAAASEDSADRPALKVVRGDSSAVELEAVVAILGARSAASPKARDDIGAVEVGRSRRLKRGRTALVTHNAPRDEASVSGVVAAFVTGVTVKS